MLFSPSPETPYTSESIRKATHYPTDCFSSAATGLPSSEWSTCHAATIDSLNTLLFEKQIVSNYHPTTIQHPPICERYLDLLFSPESIPTPSTYCHIQIHRCDVFSSSSPFVYLTCHLYVGFVISILPRMNILFFDQPCDLMFIHVYASY